MATKKIEINLTTKHASKELENLKDAYDKENKSAKEASKITAAYQSALKSLTNQMSATRAIKKSVGAIGLTIGFKELIDSAHDANMEIWRYHNQVKDLTDAHGDTGKVMSAVWKAYGSSAVSLGDTIQIMRGLNQSGIEVNDTISEMAGWIGRVGQASGVTTEALTGLMGKSIRFWNVSQKGAKEMVHSVFAAKAAFKLTSQQTQELLGIVNNTQDKMAYAFKDGEKSSIALAKGIAMAAGAMEKLGVNSQTATSFVEGLLDPTKISQNTALMRRMGITYMDQVNMMESAQGKEVFFDKLMMQLPKLSKELSSIRDPFVRMNVAQNLGLPMEIAAKMANKTSGEIQDMLVKYKDMKKAADVQQEKMKAQQERWDEAKKWIKWNALLPLMEWAQKMYKYMWPFLNAVSNGMQRANKYFASFLDTTFTAFKPIYDLITGAKSGDVINNISKAALATFSNITKVIAEKLPEVIRVATPFIVSAITTGIKTMIQMIPVVISGIGKLIRESFKENAYVGIAVLGFLNYKLWKWMQDSIFQWRYIKQQWGSTGRKLTSIDTTLKRIAAKPTGGGIDLDTPGGPGQKTPRKKFRFGGKLGKVIEAGKTGGTVAKVGAKGVKAAQTGIRGMLAVGKGISMGMKGTGMGILPSLAIDAALSALGGLAEAQDDKYKRDRLNLTAAEKQQMQTLKLKNNKTAQETQQLNDLYKREKDIAEYKKLSLIQEKRALTEVEAARLEELETTRKTIGAGEQYSIFWRGTIDTLTWGATDLAKNWGIANSEASKNAQYFSKQLSDTKSAYQALRELAKTNDTIFVDAKDAMTNIGELQDKYNKTKDKNILKNITQEKQALATKIKNINVEQTNLDENHKKNLINLQKQLTNHNMSAEQLYANLKLNYSLDGAINKSSSDAEAYSQILANMWDPALALEMQGIFKDLMTDITNKKARAKNIADDQIEKYKEEQERARSKGDMATVKQYQDLIDQRERDAQTGVMYGKKDSQIEAHNESKGASTQFLSIFKGNRDPQKQYDLMRKANEMNATQGKEVSKDFSFANQSLMQATKTAIENKAVGISQLSVMRQSIQEQLRKKKEEYETFGTFFDGAKKEANKIQQEQLATIDKQLEAEEIAQRKQAERDKKNNSWRAGMGAGVGKIVKNTEKEPPRNQDYIGNLLRYMGGNVDLRTVGF